MPKAGRSTSSSLPSPAPSWSDSTLPFQTLLASTGSFGNTYVPPATPLTTQSSADRSPGAIEGDSLDAVHRAGAHVPECTHLGQAKPSTLQRYRTLVKYSLFQKYQHRFLAGFQANQRDCAPPKGVRLQKLEAKRDAILARIPTPQCATCRRSFGQLLACLHCDFTGCWSNGHLRAHQKANKHYLAVELGTLAVYCARCRDYVYSHPWEAMLRQERLRIYHRLCQLAEPRTRRLPLAECLAPETNNHDSTGTDGALPGPCDGIRGLRNLGSTCFMNVVLQAFVHNPLLRAHFLSDPHSANRCTREACIACQMDQLYGQVFSGETTPYGPSGFLRAMWQSSTELAGYAQQDAHEFFITALNQIHMGLCGDDHTFNCPCAVHQTFAGQLQSTVTCLSCGHQAVANDPLLDVSLDLRPHTKRTRAEPLAASDDGPHSLLDCLHRFTAAESLDAQGYMCGSCGSACQAATKQLLFKSLPPVLSFQLKRFEHHSSASKIETFIRVPSELDMSPFTTRRAAGGNPRNAESASPSPPHPACHYQLFAVINHEGTLETGHYTMFARHRKQWFRFDDHLVTLASLSDVLQAKAYMCFYAKSFLDYTSA